MNDEHSTQDEYNDAFFHDTPEQESYEEDGVYGEISDEQLRVLMEQRSQRYMDGYNRPIKSHRTVSKPFMIGSIIFIAVYYMTFFALNVFGVINRLTMFLCMAPVAIILIIAYLILKHKSS